MAAQKLIFLVAMFVLLSVPAHADLRTGYDVSYYLRGDVSQQTTFYGAGAYEFLLTPNYVTVYRHDQNWIFIGMYGAPAAGYPQAALPDSMPAIAFPAGTDGAVAVPITLAGGGSPVVTTPELRVLRQLGSHYGPRVASLVNPTLQRATAIGATGALKALGISATRTENRIVLPSVTLDVIQWCSGLYTIKLLILFAAGVALLMRRQPWATRLALVLVAPLIGLQINALRVAGVGLGFEVFGLGVEWKDWAAYPTLAFGAAQILGLGWVMKRRARTV